MCIKANSKKDKDVNLISQGFLWFHTRSLEVSLINSAFITILIMKVKHYGDRERTTKTTQLVDLGYDLATTIILSVHGFYPQNIKKYWTISMWKKRKWLTFIHEPIISCISSKYIWQPTGTSSQYLQTQS